MPHEFGELQLTTIWAALVLAAFAIGRWSKRQQRPDPAAIIAGIGATFIPLLQPQTQGCDQ